LLDDKELIVDKVVLINKDPYHGNLVLRKTMLLSKQQKVTWDSQTHISEPERHTNSQTSKVWTIQMMMTLILTPALSVKTNTD
jgi:hypothetical protein